MNADELIEALGYGGTAGFLDEARWDDAIEHAHLFRHAAEACRAPRIQGRLRGIYMLGLQRTEAHPSTTPVVYVAQAPDAPAADAIHHVAWNQSVVPFLIVHTPVGVRLYSGFDYEPAAGSSVEPRHSQRGVLDAAIAFQQVATKLDAFRARSIDDGTLWVRWGDALTPERRMDVRLLGQLGALGTWLRETAKVRPGLAHALIGRFVYLRYLRERGILSDSLLRSWDIDPEKEFGRSIDPKGFRQLLAKVDERLNGSIFPLPQAADEALSIDHIRTVAGVMLGDEVETGQLHLDFRPYDFSHIPIETLSAIYEQFMAAERRDRDAGAFYTPIPLVNFVLAELDDMKPLNPGVRVFDPACGSGAFLVQCFQFLVEKRRRELRRDPSAQELRALLVEHIFGMDKDEDACRVTEFSLALALLDHIPAATLGRLHNFKLPDLHGKNIVHADFFSAEVPMGEAGYDWVVGNPPWVEASSGKTPHRPALQWINENKKERPVTNNQVAEAFAWKAATHLRPGGVVGFVLPTMTLLKDPTAFRKRFFSAFDVSAVANLTNLREVLFEKRARLPASVLFYSEKRGDEGFDPGIAVYSPLVANQEASRPPHEGLRRTAWTITIDNSEVRLIDQQSVATGDPLPWKTSMWGGPRDARLLRRVASRFQSLAEVAAARGWVLSEGLQLREGSPSGVSGDDESEALEPVPSVRGKPWLDTAPLKNHRYIHSFPPKAMVPISRSRAYGREGRVALPLSVCKPPHVIVSAARTFAVFSNRFVVVPPRQIGIAGPEEDADLLRVLSVFLGSDVAWYHQFFASPEMEYRGRSTLDALKRLPVPIEVFAAKSRPWLQLHDKLVRKSDERWELLYEDDELATDDEADELYRQMDALAQQANALSAESLGLSHREQWLVEDLVQVRRHLIDGKIGSVATRPPLEREMLQYAVTLRDELDEYLDRKRREFRHALTVVHDVRAGMIQISFAAARAPHKPVVEKAGPQVSGALRDMRECIDANRSQWLYFDRNLITYIDGKAFISKPMQRFWWTRSQALEDADRLISDWIAAGASS